MKITLESGQFGWDYFIVAEDGQDLLIQSDWDYPGTASSFGWSPCMCQKEHENAKEFDYTSPGYECSNCNVALTPAEAEQRQIDTLWGPDAIRKPLCPHCGEEVTEICQHECTDGTVDCKVCGMKTTDFLVNASDWLDAHIGDQVEDPGYFLEVAK